MMRNLEDTVYFHHQILFFAGAKTIRGDSWILKICGLFVKGKGEEERSEEVDTVDRKKFWTEK
jgi:hypothetical protein